MIATTEKTNDVSAEVINRLFEIIMSIKPAFKQAWPDQHILNAAKRQWMTLFIEKKINEWSVIERGLKKLRDESNPFPPTPAKFVEWCNPEPRDIGVPDLERAYLEACKNSHPCQTHKDWTHKVVYHAWIATGSSNLSKMDRKSSFPIFKRSYEMILKDFMRGVELGSVPITLALTNKTEGRTDKSAAKAYLNELKKTLGCR